MDSIRTREVDLTAAHTDLEIVTNRPLDFLQFWCDGGMQGITVKIGTQSSAAIRLEQVPILPVKNPEKVYITNDVRAGRSKLYIFYVSMSKLDLALGGQPISAAEQAVRLGAINSFDRRGEILWQSKGLRKLGYPYTTAVQQVGEGGYVVVSSDRSHSGTDSFKLLTGNLTDDYSELQVNLPYVSTTRHAFEAWFTITNGANHELWIIVYNGATSYQARLRYVLATTTLSVFQSASPTVVDAALNLPAEVFHGWKLVLDFDTGKYVRLMVNQNTYDLSQYNMVTAASATAPSLTPIVRIQTNADSSLLSYVDDLIVTKNEA